MKHKNFVSLAALLILVLSAVFLVTGCPTGSAPSGNTGSGGGSSEITTPPSINTEGVELTALLGKISFDRTVITSASEIITISDLPSGAAVTSSNAELIKYQSPDKLKIKKLPETTTEVKITITLTKNSTSKSRDFTVKVFKDGENPTEEDYLATLTIPTTVSDDFDLPKNLKNTENTQITWSTKNEKIIKVKNTGTGQKAVVMPDLVEQKVTLTATANGKPQEFEITVMPLVKIENESSPNSKKVYEFAQGKMTIKYFRDGGLLSGDLYSYTVDISNPDNKKITATKLSIFAQPLNKWVTIEVYYDIQNKQELEYLEKSLRGIDTLLQKSEISLKDVKKTWPDDFAGAENDKAIFEKMKQLANVSMTFEEFDQLPADKKTEKLKELLKKSKNNLAAQYFVPENTSTDKILAEAKKILRQNAAEAIKEDKKTHTYTYTIQKKPGGISFEAHQAYDSSKPWYENDGNWSYNPESSSSESSWISNFYARKGPDGTIGAFLSILEKQGGSYYNHKGYNGPIEVSGTSYTFTGRPQGGSGEPITATITDNKDGTIKVTVTEGGSASSRLKFEGNSLLIWR